MRSRAVRLTLTLLAVGALAAAAYLLWNINSRLTHDEIAAHDTRARIADAQRVALELRSAQQAYVAAGQSEEFWIAKVASGMKALQESITALRVAPLSPAGLAGVERASEALEAFARIDRRAKDQASNGQKLLASDVIFSDGLETSGQIIGALDEVAAAESTAAAANQWTARKEQALYAAGAGAIALVALLLLAPTPKSQVAIAPPAVIESTPALPSAIDSFDLGAALDAREAAPVPRPAPMPPELSDVADVCAQLARLSDTTTLPVLLQRTALALDASGVVLWLADASGAELTAVAAHGYAPNVLTRMGALGRDAENVTAAAFRTGLLQIVKADAMSNGAIAAPLVNQGGCIGVMSAEVRHEGEVQPARQAIATIVAAQLATLVSPTTRAEASVRQA
jgi:hypothetical protein